MFKSVWILLILALYVSQAMASPVPQLQDPDEESAADPDPEPPSEPTIDEGDGEAAGVTPPDSSLVTDGFSNAQSPNATAGGAEPPASGAPVNATTPPAIEHSGAPNATTAGSPRPGEADGATSPGFAVVTTPSPGVAASGHTGGPRRGGEDIAEDEEE